MSSLYLFFREMCCLYCIQKDELENRVKTLEITVVEQKKEIEGYKLAEKLSKGEVENEVIETKEIIIETN